MAEDLKLTSNPEVKKVIKAYPKHVAKKLLFLRQLILEVAEESETVERLEETLKWGEPSYLAPKGSTIRIDWKESKPNQYAMYFKCTSKLVPTFKKVFGKKFTFEGDRAIVFKLDEKVPEEELKRCISQALNYHRVKHLPLLGVN